MRPVEWQDTNWALSGWKKEACPVGAAEPFHQPHTKLRKEMLRAGEAVLVLEKLLYGLTIFLVSSCLERLITCFSGMGLCPAQIEMLSEMCLCDVLFHSPNPLYVYQLWQGKWTLDLPTGSL